MAKTVRALLLLEVVHRVFGGTPRKRLTKLEEHLLDKIEEVDEIRAQIKKLQRQIAENDAKSKSSAESKESPAESNESPAAAPTEAPPTRRPGKPHSIDSKTTETRKQ